MKGALSCRFLRALIMSTDAGPSTGAAMPHLHFLGSSGCRSVFGSGDYNVLQARLPAPPAAVGRNRSRMALTSFLGSSLDLVWKPVRVYIQGPRGTLGSPSVLLPVEGAQHETNTGGFERRPVLSPS
jgi:hypothetical protein